MIPGLYNHATNAMAVSYTHLHPNTRELLERLLTMLAEEGEKATYEYIRREVLKNKK